MGTFKCALEIIYSLNLHNNPIRKVVIISLILPVRNLDAKRLGHLIKVTKEAPKPGLEPRKS